MVIATLIPMADTHSFQYLQYNIVKLCGLEEKCVYGVLLFVSVWWGYSMGDDDEYERS